MSVPKKTVGICPECRPGDVPVGPCVLELCAACLAAIWMVFYHGHPTTAEGA